MKYTSLLRTLRQAQGKISGLALLLLLLLNAEPGRGQTISITTLGSPLTQNFDALSNTAGSTTNVLTINGWYLTETGGGARDNEQYAVDNGGSTTGDMYSYGAAAASERALGQLRSGTLVPNFGASYTNNTGATITSLAISYTGEQWRFGGVHATVADKMDFQFSTDATSLTTGTWSDINALDFQPPVTTGSATALDGNNALNRVALSFTMTGLSIPNGATFWIRWSDVDATGADDGLAVDDFSLTATGAAPPLPFLIGTIAAGDSIIIRHDVTINAAPPAGTNHIAAQWTVQGSNFATFISDDPDSAPALDSTITPLVLCPAITVTNPVVTTGNSGAAFSQTFTASGGTSPYTFTTVSVLPTGLTLSSTGVLSGTPTQLGTFPIVVTATEFGSSCTGTGSTYNLVISCSVVDQTVSASPTSVCLNGSSTITVAASQPGVNYTLRIDPANTYVAGPTASNGPAINFGVGPLAATTTYNVLAESDKYSVYLNGGEPGFVIPQAAPLDVTDNFTIEGWIKPDNIGAAFSRLFNKSGCYALGLSSGQSLITFTRHTSGDFSVAYPFVSGQWYHIACTYVSGTVEFFVNGISVGTVGGVPPVVAQPFGAQIGSESSSFHFFKGNIDNVRVWNSVRTQTQIAANQSAFLTSTGNPSLGSSWWIIEGAGNAKDYSANAINASSLSGTWVVDSPVPSCSIVLTNKPTVSIAADNTITLTSAPGTDAQSVCLGNAITNITYSTTGATGATFSGLPAGVTGNWAANVVTISGTPTTAVGSPFNYTVNLTGGCGTISATGSITVTSLATPTITPGGPTTFCAGGSVTLTSSAATGNQWYESGNPIGGETNQTYIATASGNYTVIETQSGCSSAASAVTTVTVNPTPPTPTITPGGPTTFCAGGSVTLTSSSATGNQWYESGNPIGGETNQTYIATASGDYTVIVTASGCSSAPSAIIIVTVNPIPDAVATPSSQTSCSGAPITTIALTGAVGGTTFNWTRDNTGTATGIAGAGSGNISGALTNTTNAPVTVTFTITPTASSCPGTPITATVIVNPTPNVVQVGAQTVCNGSSTSTINFSSTATGGSIVYNWTGTIGTIGLPTSGSGNILSFTAINTGTTVLTDTIKVTAAYTNAGATCNGPVMLFVITVNPTPTVNSVANQAVCNGTSTAAVNFSGAVPGTVYSWSNNTTSIGLAASGTGNIAFFTATNATSAPVTATITATPTFYNQTLQGSLLPGDLTMPSRLFRDGIPSTCAGKAFPGTSGGAHLYDLYNFTNTTGQTQCVTISYNAKSTGDVFVAAYNGSFNPAALSTNYLGDGGLSSIGGSVSTFSVSVAAGATLVVVALEANSAPCPLYVLNVNGLGLACTGTPTTFTITVNPTPTAVATPSSQTICTGSAITTIVNSGAVAGTVYNWTRDNNVAVTGITASGSGDISGSLVNTTNAAVTVTFTITPSYTNAGTTCNGTPVTATVLVAPMPILRETYNGVQITANNDGADDVGSFTVCSGTANNVVLTEITDITNITPIANVKVQQIIIKTNVTIVTSPDGVYPISTIGPLPLNRTATLVSPFVSGSVEIRRRAFYDANNNNIIDANECVGDWVVYNITVNPVPDVTAIPASQTICSAGTITTIVNSGNVPGTVFNWTRDNTGTVTGIAASGSGNISGALTNTTNAPVTVTFTITPSYTNAGNTCTGTATTATVLVNPTATINAVANQVLCNGASSTAINFSSPTTGGTIVYNWTNTNTSIGLAASGTGNIGSFAAINTGSTPQVATITATPTYTNGVTCVGTPITFTITVNPPPAMNLPASQTVCNNTATAAVNFTTPLSGGTVVYNWTNNNTSIGLGASGTGNIPSFIGTNATNVAAIATISVVMSYTNAGLTCVSLPYTFTITVDPTPTVNPVTSQVVCNNGTTTPVSFTGAVAGTLYNWTNNTTSIGLAASGLGDIASFTATNTGTAPVTATITVTPTIQTSQMAYIGNYYGGNVSLINLGTNTVVNTIPGVVASYSVSMHPSGTKVYMGGANGVITQINTATNTVAGTIGGGGYVVSLAHSPDGSKLYAADYNLNNLRVINTATNAVITTVPVGTQPFGVIASADGTKVYVANQASNSVTVINAITNAVITTIPSVPSATGLALSADGTKLYASAEFSNTVAIINTTTNAVTGTITVPGTPGPFVVTASPDGTRLYVCNEIANTVAVFNAITNAFITAIPVGTTPQGMSISADGARLYVGNIGSNNVSVINTATNTVGATIPVGNGPWAYGNFLLNGPICSGSPQTFTITVNPTATVNAVANQVVCNGASTTAVNFSSPTTGGTIVYNWTNNIPSIGLAASGSGNIASFAGTNATSAPVTATITVTPAYTNGAVTCNGTPITFTITVNPTATVNAVANQVVCNNASTTAVNFSSPTTGGTIVYNWTNNTPSIGLAASGSGNIASFTATNATNAPVVATITVTPAYTNGAVTCNGTPLTFTITVNPTATINTVANQNLCNGASTTAITFSSPTTGGTIVYNWTNNTTSIGLAASGSGNIGSFVATNATNSPVTATITVTPSYTNGAVTCIGTSITFTITVYPTPQVDQPVDQVICNNTLTAPVNFTSPTTGSTIVYNWINNTTSIGLAASGSGNIASFTGTNATNAPVTATITVTPSNSVNNALTFNGVQQVNVTPAPTIPIGNSPYTIEAWVKPNSVAGANGIVGWGNWGAINEVNALRFNGPTQLINYWWANDLVVNIPNVLDGNWHHIVATFNGTTRSIYMDGILRGSDNPTGHNIPFANNMSIARTCPFCGSGEMLDGSIDEMRIWNVGRTQPQIVANMNSTIASNSPGLAAYYRMDEGSGLATADLTGNGNNGSLNTVLTWMTPSTAPITNTVCVGPPKTFTITVNPTATVNAVANQVICNNTATTAVNFSSPTTGGTIVYNWTNNTPSIGLAASGSGNIASFTGTNATNAPVTATITVTPSYTNGGVTCIGTSITFTITVNPTATINAVADQVVCNNTATTAVNFSSPTTGGTIVYNWTNNTPSIGLATSGSGNIASFIGTNATNAPVTATITVTPSYTNGVTCIGTPITFTITVNPTPIVNPVTSQIVCNTTNTTVNFSSPTTGGTLVYNWTNNNPAIGLAASGSGNIAFISTNTTPDPITGTITVTPSYTNGGVTCVGAPVTFTITVNPTVVINPVPDQVVCNGAGTAAINFTSATSLGVIVYNWTNTNPAIGLAASGTGNIASFVATNTTNAPITGSITVTPTYIYGISCVGIPITFTITVNPTATVNTVANQVVCNNSATAAVNFSSPATGGTIVYNWTNNAPSIGLAASGSGDIASFIATTTGTAPVVATITVIPAYTNGGTTCNGTPITFTITVNPTATVNAVANQGVCNGSGTTAISFSSPTTGGTIVYNWTNNAPSIGLAASGSGNIASFIATNTGTTPVVATITVTPAYTNGAVTCNGTPMTFTITVNPTATVNAVANQVVCNNAFTTAINFSSPATGGTIVYNWTNSAPSIGLASSGSGNIASFQATNTTNAPITATITVTPAYTNAGVICNGTPISFTIIVNPTATVNPVINQVTCNFSPTNAINFSSPTTGGTIVYNWTNSAPSIGLAASGTGNIASFIALNTTNAPVTATIVVTPSYTNAGLTCTGMPLTFTITVNPTATVVPLPNMTVCNGALTTPITFNSPTTGGTITYNWTNTNTSIGLAAIGTGNIPAFTGTNTTNAPITGIITVAPTFTNGGVTCDGAGQTFNITVNPTPNAVATPSTQTVCSSTPMTNIVLTGNVAGTVFTWTRNNSTNVTGIALSGTGNISGIPVNITNAQQTVVFTITPVYTNAGVSCSGTPITATLIVPAPLSIVCPANIVVSAAPGTCAATVTFAATAVGTPTPTITYSHAPGSSFPVGTTTVTVTATNTCGTVTCTFTVTVTDAQVPVITTQPANQTICQNSTATFIVAGTLIGSYQWQIYNGIAWVNIPGATTATLTLNNVTLAQHLGLYRVQVTGPCATTVTSVFVTLRVNALPTIQLTTSIDPPLLMPGQTLSIIATGIQPGGTFVWKRNGVVIPGATTATLPGITSSDIGAIFEATYTDANGCTSLPATITIGGKESINFYVYPNPNNGQFHIRFFNQANEKITVQVFNSAGALVFQRGYAAGPFAYSVIDIDLGNRLPDGSYMVQLLDGDGKPAGSKIIIVHRNP